MHELMLLIQVNFKQMLHTFSVGRGSKKNMGTLGALGLMAFLALYLSGIYSWMLGDLLREAGALFFLLPVMMLLAVAASLMLSFFSASGIVFGGRDSDFMLSLPVSAFTVMLAKMSALYLENLVFTGLWMLPCGAAAWYFGTVSDPLFLLRLAAAILFLPLLPSLLAALGGFFITWAQARMKHKVLAANLVSLALLALLLLSCLQINQLGALFLTHQKEAMRLFFTWLAPIGFLGKGLLGDWLSLLAGLFLCLLPFLLVTWLFSAQYQQILSGLKSRSLRTDYRLTRVTGSGPFSALFQKELKRLFSSSVYLLNTGISVFLLIGLAVFLLINREQLALFADAFGTDNLPLLFLGCMAMLLSMVYPSAVSLSLEGKNLWLLKEAPISPAVLFGAKAALNLVLAWPASLLAVLLFSLTGSLPVPDSLCILLVCLGGTGFLAVAGLVLNLHFPKTDCGNETIIIKQSASSMLAVFGAMLFVLLLAGLWFLLWKLFSFPALCLLTATLLAVLTALLWRWLMTRGAQIFLDL